MAEVGGKGNNGVDKIDPLLQIEVNNIDEINFVIYNYLLTFPIYISVGKIFLQIINKIITNLLHQMRSILTCYIM